MCDFFSAVITANGQVFHLPSNSHSGIVAHYKLTENDTRSEMRDKARFFEYEWDGEGKVPENIKAILRGRDHPQVVLDAAKVLAKNLKRALDEPGWGLTGDGAFAGEEYADLRWKALIHEKCPHEVAKEIAVRSLHSHGETIKSLHPLVSNIDGEKGFVVMEGYSIAAPALTKSGSVDVSANATFTAPALTKSGYVYVSANATFTAPALTKSGSVYVRENATFTAPALTEVTGYVKKAKGAKFDAPQLKKGKK